MTSAYRLVTMAGDVAVIVLFAAIGRAAHAARASNPLLDTFFVALPFLAGWLVAGLWLYRLEPVTTVQGVVLRVVSAWTLADAIALTIRSVAERRVMPVSFVGVSLIFGWIMLIAWRLCLLTLSRRRILPA